MHSRTEKNLSGAAWSIPDWDGLLSEGDAASLPLGSVCRAGKARMDWYGCTEWTTRSVRFPGEGWGRSGI